MIRLPKRIQATRVLKRGVPVAVAGWGRTTDSKTKFNLQQLVLIFFTIGRMEISGKLKTVKLVTLDDIQCVHTFGKSSYTQTNMCALGRNGGATCQVRNHLKTKKHNKFLFNANNYIFLKLHL